MHKVGWVEGTFEDETRRNWSDTGPRPVRWTAWYPAADDAAARPTMIGEPEPVFELGELARDAEFHGSSQRRPVVLLSNGTGGAAVTLGRLGAFTIMLLRWHSSCLGFDCQMV